MFNLTPGSAKRLPIHQEAEYPLYSIQREMNRLFDEFFRAPMREHFREMPTAASEQSFGNLTLHVDMSETDKEILVKVELPGMTEKDIDISMTRDILTISGEKKQEKDQSEKGWYRMERQYGSFSRSIPLPYEIEGDKVEAIFKHGVLSIKLPKSVVQKKGAKNIPVKSA